jgi:WD40 repeat protein
VHLWDTSNNTLRRLAQLALPAGGRGVSTLSFQRSSGWMVAGCGSGVVRLWDLQR